jgi:hypothetical protein
MHFSIAVNFLVLGVAIVVSALPITQFTSSAELESRDDFDVPHMFERDFYEPSLYRRVDYHVALHKSDVNSEKEHWAIHVHPQSTHASASWHKVHAVSDKTTGTGVLYTEHKPMGGKGKGYDTARQTPQGHEHMILGSNIKSAGDAKKIAESLKGLHCEHPFPGENCVDWTKKAVEKLHADGHIDTAHKDQFMEHYNTHEATVRTNTGKADAGRK